MEYLNTLNLFELIVLGYLAQFVVTGTICAFTGVQSPTSLKDLFKKTFMPYMALRFVILLFV